MENKRARKQVSHYAIFDYWKDKVITSDGEVVLGKNRPHSDYEWIVSDNIEPSCWGCGLPAISSLEEDGRHVGENELPSIWNDKNVKHELERCHIVPHALGGADAPDNMFLLCGRCHHESPDTTNPRNFFRWVYNRRKSYTLGYLSLRGVYEMLDKEIKDRGLNVSPVDVLKMIFEKDPQFNGKSFEEYINKNVGQHGFDINRNSLVCGYVDWLLHSFVEVSLKD